MVFEDDPNAGTIVVVVTRTNRASELSDLEAGSVEHVCKDASRIVHEVAESLGNQNAVHIARSRLVELEKIIIRQRLFERNLDGGGRLVLVGNDAQGHGA